jgi:hypothetical protein
MPDADGLTSDFACAWLAAASLRHSLLARRNPAPRRAGHGRLGDLRRHRRPLTPAPQGVDDRIRGQQLERAG